jgi:hypothetical protein
MNGHYAEFFPSTAIGGYATAFRIAHAQKSLSLLLKHYWCNNAMSEPPLCPIDRRILLIAEARHAQAKWTDIDTMNDYRAKLAMLNVAKQSSMFAPISLSGSWRRSTELRHWLGSGSPHANVPSSGRSRHMHRPHT